MKDHKDMCYKKLLQTIKYGNGLDGDNEQERKRFPIILALWVIFFLQCGIMKSIGVLLPVLLEQFATHTRTIGVVVSFSLFAGNATGILAPSLAKIFAARSIVLACGVLSTIGLLISAMTPNIPIFVIGMFFTGLTCMGETLAIGMLSSYFIKYYSAAANIITTATPLSIMCFAPLTQLFIDIYGWRGTMILLAGLNFHYVAAAAMLRPIRQVRTVHHESRPTYQSLKERDADVEKDESIVKSESGDEKSTSDITKECLTGVFNISLLKNGSFIVVLIVSTIIGYGFNGWVVYLVSFAQSKGLSPYDAATVATISGVGSFLIRFAMAFLQGKTSYRLLFYFGSILYVLSYAGLYFATTFVGVSFVSLILGFGYGILGTQIYIAANVTVGKDEVVSAVAWIHMLHGIGYLANGYITGWLHDMTGSFNLSMIELSAVSSLMVVILASEDIWNKLHGDN
ncbi:monocarboxylate transporter 11-like [Amphiura filiformis]|uniref:monocarboxylate transporter 11-like n=1 Tax=Amphiura filiformis TaxID=82378 RepID=UPI003B21172E